MSSTIFGTYLSLKLCRASVKFNVTRVYTFSTTPILPALGVLSSLTAPTTMTQGSAPRWDCTADAKSFLILQEKKRNDINKNSSF